MRSFTCLCTVCVRVRFISLYNGALWFVSYIFLSLLSILIRRSLYEHTHTGQRIDCRNMIVNLIFLHIIYSIYFHSFYNVLSDYRKTVPKTFELKNAKMEMATLYVQCGAVYYAVNLLKNPHNMRPIREIWGVFYEQDVWFRFCRSHRSAACNIVINWTALKRHSTVFMLCLQNAYLLNCQGPK